MKRTVTWILIAVMLLGLLPVFASAETADAGLFDNYYTLTLRDGIGMTFRIAATNLTGDSYTVKFYKDGTAAGTLSTLPEAREDGYVYVTLYNVGPHEMNVKVHAELYAGTELAGTTGAVSILDYCTAAKSETDTELNTLLTNMLYYGVAAGTYAGTDTTAVSALLTEWEATAPTGLARLREIVDENVYIDPESATATWTDMGLTLSSGVQLRGTFTTEAEGITVEVSCGGKTWTVSDFEIDGSSYTFRFAGLNPAQFRKITYMTVKDANGNAISDTIAYSPEEYTIDAPSITGLDETTQANLESLTEAMMYYGDAAQAYFTRDITSGKLTDEELASLAALTEMDAKTHCMVNSRQLTGVLPWIFKEAGIDITTHENYVSLTYSNAYKAAGGTYSGGDAANTFYSAMLVEDSRGTKVTGIGGEVQPGDIVCAYYTHTWENITESNTKTLYGGYIYLGNDKFLGIYDEPTADSVGASGAAAIFTSADLENNPQGGVWSARWILRAEQLAGNRDASLRHLTEAEKGVIANLTVADWSAGTGSSRGLQAVLPWVFEEAGIDLTTATGYAALSFSKFATALNTSSNTNHAYCTSITVDGTFVQNQTGVGVSEFQIGDIFCGYYFHEKDTSSAYALYYAAIYQGIDDFLVLYDLPTYTDDVVTGRALGTAEAMTWEELAAITWRYQWVIRPDQLAD